MLTKKMLTKKICWKKIFVNENIWPKFTKCFFRKAVVDQNSQNVFFRKSVVGQNSQNVFFPKIGRTRFPKSVHGLSAREKLSVFVCTSFFRVTYPVKFGCVRRRKYHVFTKCQNFSGDTVFLQNTFCVEVHCSGCTKCAYTYFCPTQKICAKSWNVCTWWSVSKNLSIFVKTAFFRGVHFTKFGNSRWWKACVSTKCQNFSRGHIFL